MQDATAGINSTALEILDLSQAQNAVLSHPA
jgi:hypothetical protein